MRYKFKVSANRCCLAVFSILRFDSGKNECFWTLCRSRSKQNRYLIVRVRFLIIKLNISISKKTYCVITVAFHSALDALNAPRLFQNEAWTPAPIKVRMGIHTGALISTSRISRQPTNLLGQACFLEAGEYLRPRGRARLSQLLNGKGRGQIAHKR